MSSPSAALPDARVTVFDAVKALAFVGDLSMGQPVDHSARTAWIAAQLAAALGLGGDTCSHAAYVSLLRWSGCTANAPEFSELMGDDVGGRQAMLAAGLPAHLAGSIAPLAQIHCEVSGDVAHTLGMPPAVERSLRQVFERHDGHGPHGLRPPEIPAEVFIVSAASDLEIFSRVYDLERALSYLASRAAAAYPAELVEAVRRHAVDWLHTLEQDPACVDTAPVIGTDTTSLELIADVIDLKLPWLTGYSRRVAQVAAACAERLGLPALSRQRLYRAGLVHGMGRAAVPNALWDQPSAPSESAMERLRLVPYWTARAARRIGSLADEAELASHADERLDGSGFFRGVSGAAIGAEARVLAVATQSAMLQTARPGRAALSFDEALAQLQRDAQRGLFDADVVAALGGASRAVAARADAEPASTLTGREVEVLRCISLGESNKEAARTLGISPSTVRAHLENIFRKLECTTRAAATLKAMTTGVL
ncbi:MULTISPECIES: HD domain-containing phosphohydrolase [unclassified Rhizobacter]|uniref:HD domain-containing phosphohydrolase n=1 Tax=unclassified Rhizobacter TaxID=2640088 RepID=UPI0006FEC4E2|nr:MULTISPECIES: HD domain-containing phosphohydrolase [unclassified Rhizobacter]KQU80682.1 LuxR family transcriptional regulator [Rhizobacter sp. Root29]KQW09641.1 LuxR family transcriptional regulator [Rhizobacter sp. Root1238]KRB14652.1 LuxR family transcriptional regulator [Rhizobacter sp. Root16D2]